MEEKNNISEYDDKYRVSINKLFYDNYPVTNVKQIETILDKNGYYGRYRIHQIRTSGAATGKIEIKVYLPKSVYWYSYPFQTYYSLNEKRIIPPKPKIKFDPCLKDLMYKLLEVPSIPEEYKDECDIIGWLKSYIKITSSYDYVRINNFFAFLFKFRFFINNEFVIKDEEEICEFYDNLFDNTWQLI